jgi:prepilin-type N-terminal cleavage/methylation domain-containing protein
MPDAGCWMKQSDRTRVEIRIRIQHQLRHLVSTAAFTLIELMVVVAVMGVILTIRIPSILTAEKRHALRSDVWEVCNNAPRRSFARPVEVVFHRWRGALKSEAAVRRDRGFA